MPETLDRRTFMKNTAAAAGAFGLSSLLGSSSAHASVAAGGAGQPSALLAYALQ